MRHILAGLTLAGMLTLGTLAAFAGDNSAKDASDLQIDAATAVQLQPQDDTTSVAVPYIVEKRGENMDNQDHSSLEF